MRPFTAFCTAVRSVVGLTSTPDVDAKETTPTLTSTGTAARKSLTAARTVTMPETPMEPLVSMTSIVVRGLDAAGWIVTGTLSPATVAVTLFGSTTTALAPRRMRVPVTVVAVGRRSLSDARTASAA